jgi:hypothetical protein
MKRCPQGKRQSVRGGPAGPKKLLFPFSLLPLTALAFAAVLLGVARGQQVHRNGFEGRQTAWVKGGADTAFRENVHEISDQLAHLGQRSEHIRITAEPGNYVYYQYPTSRALLSEELTASVWVKASRPGVQFLARLVLPHERNPNSLDDHLTLLIRGDYVRSANGWQRLELRGPVDLAKKQQALMQGSLKRPINIKDAYVDALVLNLYAGPGLTEVWIDDLEIGPVLDPAVKLPGSPAAGAPANPAKTTSLPRPAGRAVDVRFSQDQLLVNNQRFFLRGIRHSDAPLETLRDAHFNTIWVDHSASPTLLQQAADLGFWLIPSLPVTIDQQLTSADTLSREVSRFPTGDAVLFWDLGGALTYEQSAAVARSVRVVAGADPGRPIGGDVWDGFQPYSRTLNLLGVHRWPLMTTLELPKYREWLNQRRLLANPGTFLWTWIQTHLPEWYTNLVYEHSGATGFNEPVGPEPEQIRLLTYTALAAGCRGIGFWSDRFLADSHQGRDRLQVLALLNQELEMLEPLLVAVDAPPVWIDTSVPEVKAAVLRTPRAVLVLPMWLGNGAQFVPGQSAAVQVNMVVPQVPQSTQPWEVTPGEIRAGLRPERVPGGTKITLPEFGLTTAVVFTSDTALIVRFQEQVKAKRQLAAQWTRDLAYLELAKMVKVEDQLEKIGHGMPDAKRRIKDAQDRLKTCDELWNNRLFGDAYREAQRALRPVRVLMREQWEKATKALTTPVATPYAVSFYTLPRHWSLMDLVQKMKPGPSVLPNGDFELDTTKPMAGWVRQDLTLDEVALSARRVPEVEVEIARPRAASPASTTGLPGNNPLPKPAPAAPPRIVKEPPKEGRQCLLLEIKPKDPANVPAALQRTYLGINTPPVHLPPGTWVQISGWVRIPKAITASADGALLFDSAGGEPLGVRLTDVTPWKLFTLYRKVPPSGSLQVTMALTGLGKVYFDDIRIQPLVPGPGKDIALGPQGTPMK